MTYDDKATSRLQGEQPESFHRVIDESISVATGGSASYDPRGVTVSAAAMPALGLAE